MGRSYACVGRHALSQHGYLQALRLVLEAAGLPERLRMPPLPRMPRGRAHRQEETKGDVERQYPDQMYEHCGSRGVRLLGAVDCAAGISIFVCFTWGSQAARVRNSHMSRMVVGNENGLLCFFLDVKVAAVRWDGSGF